MVLMAVQLSVPGSYLLPVLKSLLELYPPHMIISVPVQTTVGEERASGTLVMLVAVQLSVLGWYLPPVFSKALPSPPQTIISLPVHTAV